MVYLIEPAEIIVEFLRAELIDPRGRHSTTTETFNGDDATTEFTLTPASGMVRAIVEVSIGVTDKKKHQDYSIDLDSGKINFLIAPATGVDNVSVTYKYSTGGNEWIYPDMPRVKDLSTTKFPRISVIIANETGNRAGNYQAPVLSAPIVQIDVWTKEDYTYAIGGRNYEDNELTRYLARKCEQAFNNEIDELYPKLYNYIKRNLIPMPFDEKNQLFRHTLEISLLGVDLGE